MKSKNLVLAVLLSSMILALPACTSTDSSSSEKSSSVADSSSSKAEESVAEETEAETEAEAKTESEKEASVATASGVFDYLKANTANIGTFVEYDEETDTNGLLGRPNQYTSKINFEITTLDQPNPDDPVGGSIEVFTKHEDAVKRQEYIQSLGKEMSALAEYDYVNDYVLLRINYDVTPSDEKQYEEALDAYMATLK